MVLLTGVFVLYFVLLILLLTGWNRAMRQREVPPLRKRPLISVVIPVRNEEMRMWTLLENLSLQEYTPFEIVVVDDDSQDETLWVARQSDLKNLRVIQSKGRGKKEALASGIRASKGTIVVTTDADCLFPPQWLTLVCTEFQDPAVMMAFGGVRMEGDSAFAGSLQEMEFSSLIGSGASTAALGFPTMCNGANLAFRKKVFSEVKGYDDNLGIPSGDDEFLMHKVNKAHPGSIRFINKPSAVVRTEAQPGLRAFLNQRIRWASKWRYNSSAFAKTLAVLVLVLQISFIANWVLLFSPDVLPALFLMAVKMILEAAFLLQVCRFLETRWNWLAFLALQVLYPVYVVAVAAASFTMPFQWKNRIFKPREKAVSP